MLYEKQINAVNGCWKDFWHIRHIESYGDILDYICLIFIACGIGFGYVFTIRLSRSKGLTKAISFTIAMATGFIFTWYRIERYETAAAGYIVNILIFRDGLS